MGAEGTPGRPENPERGDGTPEVSMAARLLRLCAPRDAEVALADLDEERGTRGGGRARFWGQLLLVCAWGLRYRWEERTLRPLHALRMALRGLRRTPGT